LKIYLYKYKIKVSTIAFLIILISTILRLIVAANVEFGNDEVYYWLYALYPDLSHFDHPPMVGFFIQFFTFNLYFDSEIWIRLASIIPASFNMFLLYKLGVLLKDELAGLINILLYNISIYGLVISGTFILPDSPLLTFWLLSFFYFFKTLPLNPKNANKSELGFAFLFASLAIYSKYQGVFILLGVGLYVLFYNRSWLKEKLLYLYLLLPVIPILLIFYWNYSNDFVSFSFHNNRVSLLSFNLNKTSFVREILGQIIYNTPLIIFLTVIVLVAYYKKKWKIEKKIFQLFAVFVFPLILTVIYLSLFRNTLPHWSGVSYITLLPLLGWYVADKKKYIKTISYTCLGMFVLLFFAKEMVNKGWLLPEDTSKKQTLGSKDFTLDMYGWKQGGEKVASFFKKNQSLKDISILSNKWFPAAHIDYYLAKPMGKKVYAIGSLQDIHKYDWINKKQTLQTSNLLYITDSKNFKDPKNNELNKYKTQRVLTEIPITRNNKIVKYIFIYLLSNIDDSKSNTNIIP
jgi:hypothetical protein